MWKDNLFISIGRWLRKYLVLILILATFTAEIADVALNGMGPRPQLPPDRYEVEQGLVTLQWNRGNIEKPITLQVSENAQFEPLIVNEEVSGTTYSYRTKMERGRTYYWRLLQDEQPSAMSRFVISAQHVNL